MYIYRERGCGISRHTVKPYTATGSKSLTLVLPVRLLFRNDDTEKWPGIIFAVDGLYQTLQAAIDNDQVFFVFIFQSRLLQILVQINFSVREKKCPGYEASALREELAFLYLIPDGESFCLFAYKEDASEKNTVNKLYIRIFFQRIHKNNHNNSGSSSSNSNYNNNNNNNNNTNNRKNNCNNFYIS